MWLALGGFQEKGPDNNHHYNTHVLLDDKGNICSTYRKIHLYMPLTHLLTMKNAPSTLHVPKIAFVLTQNVTLNSPPRTVKNQVPEWRLYNLFFLLPCHTQSLGCCQTVGFLFLPVGSHGWLSGWLLPIKYYFGDRCSGERSDRDALFLLLCQI